LDAVAEEMNVCDEAVAIDVVKEILMSASKEIEMRQFKRHTELVVDDAPDASLGTIEKATDCLVCFNKHHYHMKLS
jgi:hypothetical protein